MLKPLPKPMQSNVPVLLFVFKLFCLNDKPLFHCRLQIYEGYSKSNAPNFIVYKQIIIATCIIHQKKGTSVRITFLLLHIVSTSLKSYSPSMNEDMYTSVVELSRLMSKPIQDSSFHFIVIAISVAPESFFHWTKEVVV